MLVSFHDGICRYLKEEPPLASRGSIACLHIFNSARLAGDQNIRHCGSKRRLTLADIRPVFKSEKKSFESREKGEKKEEL